MSGGPTQSNYESETGALGGTPSAIDVGTDVSRGNADIFFAAVEATRMPMAVTDPRQPDHPIVFCNPAFSNLTGYSFEEIVGRNCRFLQGPDSDRATVDAVRNAIANRQEIAVELLNYRKNGSSFWNALYLSPVFDKEGELVYYFGSQLDVSRRRDAEEALRQAQKMEALGQLTGGIAHDFNNLLQVIVGYLDSIKSRGEQYDPQFMNRAIEAMTHAAERGATLTQQLLAFARKQRLDGRLVDLNDVVGNFRTLIERTMGSHVEIDFALSPEACLVKVDTTQAEMAVLNVLINSRDAMPDGGKIFVQTETRTVDPGDQALFGELAPGNYAVLSISDTGQGIPPELLARVTEPFFTTKEQGKGTGLGLSMVYGFAKQSGGLMRIYSEVGHGTTTRLFFPLQQDEKASERGRLRQSDVNVQPGVGSILVVEDQIDVGDLAQSILEDFGYVVHRASNGQAAIDLIESNLPIDLLFTDLIMPGGINGVVLARRAREARPNLRILLTTGYAELSVDSQTVATGEFDIISKPYRRSDLARKIKQAMDGPNGVS